MKQQHKLQPKVRFPEFEGDWIKERLENIALRGSGHTPNKQMNSYYDGDIKWISLADSKQLDQGFIKNTEITISIEGIKNSSAVLHKKGTVLLSRDAGIGKSAVMYEDMAVSQHFITWTCDDVILNNWFLYYKLQILKPEFERIAVGTTIKTIGLPYFKKLSFSIPNIYEQQKIADYLSTIDTKINLLEEKKAQLALYKKAMMQKLFSQEIRFKPTQCHTEPVEVEPVEVDINEAYPEWEEKRLGEVVSLKGGYAFKSDLFKENGVPIMRISNISNNNIYIDENNMVYYDDFKISNSYKVFTGELLIALSGATTGKASIYNLENFSYVNQRVGVFKSINKCYYNFIVQYIFSSSFTKELKKMLVAGAQPNISTSEIESIILNMPTSEKEQQKIADFLSAIDASIEKVNEQINQTQSFKKAMLQQMFV